jgi:hypothetical protein
LHALATVALLLFGYSSYNKNMQAIINSAGWMMDDILYTKSLPRGAGSVLSRQTMRGLLTTYICCQSYARSVTIRLGRAAEEEASLEESRKRSRKRRSLVLSSLEREGTYSTEGRSLVSRSLKDKVSLKKQTTLGTKILLPPER